MKFKKCFKFLIAWYLISFYATVVSAVDSYRAEHQFRLDKTKIEYGDLN